MRDMTLGAYWPDRYEPIDSCLERAWESVVATASHLNLRDADMWTIVGEVGHRVVDEDAFRHLTTEDMATSSPDIGVTFGVIFGRSVYDADCGLNANVGCASRWLGNRFVVSVNDAERVPAIVEVGPQQDLMGDVARLFDPDWITVFDHRLVLAQGSTTASRVIGQVTYISERLQPSLDTHVAGVELERVGAHLRITIDSGLDHLPETSIAVRKALQLSPTPIAQG